jgi:hypothetical protein
MPPRAWSFHARVLPSHDTFSRQPRPLAGAHHDFGRSTVV